MKKQTDINLENLMDTTNATIRHTQMLFVVQKIFLAICIMTLFLAFLINYLGTRSDIVIYLGITSGLFGFGTALVGRRGQSLSSKVKKNINVLSDVQKIIDNKDVPKIPLSIGFSNLSGEDLRKIASEDAAILSTLFEQSMIVADHQLPSANILFVYAHLNEDGTIKGSKPASIRQIVQLTKAAVLILASPNSPNSIKMASSLPGPKTANIVFTLDRNGTGFTQFFRELFEKMRDGKDMLNAWVELAPQNPSSNPQYAPQTILMAEGGKIVFPSPVYTDE